MLDHMTFRVADIERTRRAQEDFRMRLSVRELLGGAHRIEGALPSKARHDGVRETHWR